MLTLNDLAETLVGDCPAADAVRRRGGGLMVATADVVCEPRRQHSLASSAQRFSGMMARVAATELPMANGVRLSGAVAGPFIRSVHGWDTSRSPMSLPDELARYARFIHRVSYRRRSSSTCPEHLKMARRSMRRGWPEDVGDGCEGCETRAGRGVTGYIPWPRHDRRPTG